MKSKRELLAGTAIGAVAGVIARLLIGLMWSLETPAAIDNQPPAAQAAQSKGSQGMVVEIQQAAQMPSAEARTAVETGFVKFIIRGKNKADDTDVARILLDLGALPLSREGDIVRMWTSDGWQTVKTFDSLSGYAIGRAWEVVNHNSLGPAGAQLSSSAETFLLMPVQEELNLVGAVEKALSTPLANYSRIEVTVERTHAGHVRWMLQRAFRLDRTPTTLNLALPL